MKTHYVFIDYENVQPEAMAELDKDHIKVVVFVGSSQAKVTFEVASVLQQMGERAEYVKIAGNGSNALDFHIAFYIGQLAAFDPEGEFHIVSRDTGFDPLIHHLKSRSIVATRSKDVGDVPIIKPSQPKASAEKLAIVMTNLEQRGASRPRTVKTLSSSINSLFKMKLTEHEVTALLHELEKKGVISVANNKVSYNLPN